MKKQTFYLIILLWLLIGALSCTKPAKECWTCQWSGNNANGYYKDGDKVTVCQAEMPTRAMINEFAGGPVKNCRK